MPTSRIFLCSWLLTLSSAAALAQQDPVLRANSRTVDIQDGEHFWKGLWTIDPSVALDVYRARRTASAKTITFITDIDSMSVDVLPGQTYDFTILLNGTDACPTRISTMMQAYERPGRGDSTGPDSIPFTIKRGKPHVQGTLNGSETLDFMFDTGADTIVLFPSAMKKGAGLRFDGTVDNAGTGGTTRRRTSNDNSIEVAGLRWSHEPVLFVEKQADDADGIIGYRLFEDRVVEIDFDRMVMFIHEAPPAHAAEFARMAMPSCGSLTALEATLVNKGAGSTGLFILDTGGNGTLMVNKGFSVAHGFDGAMTKLGTSTSRGVGSGTVRNDVVMLPELVLAGFTLSNVPINLEVSPGTGPATPGGALCMDVLQRFNLILDYRRGEAYFKPNALFGTPFPPRSSAPSLAFIAGVVAAVAGPVVVLAWLRARRRSAAPRA